MTDKAHSQQRFPTEEYRKGWEEAFAKPWNTCVYCGMTREKTKYVHTIGHVCHPCTDKLAQTAPVPTEAEANFLAQLPKPNGCPCCGADFAPGDTNPWCACLEES